MAILGLARHGLRRRVAEALKAHETIAREGMIRSIEDGRCVLAEGNVSNANRAGTRK